MYCIFPNDKPVTGGSGTRSVDHHQIVKSPTAFHPKTAEHFHHFPEKTKCPVCWVEVNQLCMELGLVVYSASQMLPSSIESSQEVGHGSMGYEEKFMQHRRVHIAEDPGDEEMEELIIEPTEPQVGNEKPSQSLKRAYITEDYKAAVDIVLLQYLDDKPLKILRRAASDHKVEFSYCTQENGTEYLCILSFNTVDLAQAAGSSQKKAINAAAKIALHELQKLYPTIKVAKLFEQGMKVISRDYLMSLSANLETAHLSRHDVDFEVTFLMQWLCTKGRYRTSESGPVTSGYIALMFKNNDEESQNSFQLSQFMKNCFYILEEFVEKMSLDNLRFFSLSSKEIDIIQYFASKMGLATRKLQHRYQKYFILEVMIGPPEDKMNLLLEHGRSSRMYKLIKPTALDS
ncbi:hypothetical protein QAD02_010430 [Eretmocerus hayati]|uniref:Uncharacterized protein n=1 Tax=Eretmocerus hayati TaxID=131215 RepID=A0ACC2NWG8_9HYME|nr:hypothetical protein QAD02_010430 [Eretmocerus hayati]